MGRAPQPAASCSAPVPRRGMDLPGSDIRHVARSLDMECCVRFPSRRTLRWPRRRSRGGSGNPSGRACPHVVRPLGKGFIVHFLAPRRFRWKRRTRRAGLCWREGGAMPPRTTRAGASADAVDGLRRGRIIAGCMGVVFSNLCMGVTLPCSAPRIRARSACARGARSARMRPAPSLPLAGQGVHGSDRVLAREATAWDRGRAWRPAGCVPGASGRGFPPGEGFIVHFRDRPPEGLGPRGMRQER